MRSFTALLACGFCMLSLAACGGATQSDLFSPPGDGGPTVIDTGTYDTQGFEPPPDSSVPIADTGTVVLEDTSVADTATPPPPDTGPPPGMGLPCGNGPTCETGDVCCATGSLQNVTLGCSTASACSGTPIACSTPEDCPGAVCCGTETGTGQGTHYVGVQCQASCNGITFCDPKNGGSDCPNNDTCNASMLLPGYYVCR